MILIEPTPAAMSSVCSMSFDTFESLPIPRDVLEAMEIETSSMKCKPSNLPSELKPVAINDGQFLVYNDGRLCVLIKLPKLDENSKVAEEGSIHVLFYEHTFSMFAATACKGCSGMPVMLDDGFYNMPCGEALFHMMKAALFKDWDSFKKIYHAATPKECKAAGGKVSNFVDAEWQKKAAGCMTEIARLKLQCPDVYTAFKAITDAAGKHGIPEANIFFYESTPKDKRYGTGLCINEMVQAVFELDEAKAIRKVVEPITPPKLGGLCYDGDNVLGIAITEAFKIFSKLGGSKRSVEEFIEEYRKSYGRSFYKTILCGEEDMEANAKKKLKLDETVPMEEGLEVLQEIPIDRTPSNATLTERRASTPSDVRSLSDGRTLSETIDTLADIRTLSEGLSGRSLSIARSGSMD